MSYTSHNFCLFHVSNLSVLNYRIVLLMYPGSVKVVLLCRLGGRADGGKTDERTTEGGQRTGDGWGASAVCHSSLLSVREASKSF